MAQGKGPIYYIYIGRVGTLPHHYTVLHPRRPRHESSSPWKPQISYSITIESHAMAAHHVYQLGCYRLPELLDFPDIVFLHLPKTVIIEAFEGLCFKDNYYCPGLDDRDSMVRFLAAAGNISFHQRVQNGSGAHPASYPMGTRGFFPGNKAAGAWIWPFTSIKCRGQRMRGSILPLPQYTFMVWCSVKRHTENFTFTFYLFIRLTSI
jgi:hypothetical protein